MSTASGPGDPGDIRFERELRRIERRKQRARRRAGSFVSWLGTFGLVGWSIALPALAFAAIGAWLDRRLDDHVSWTLTLLLAGMAAGCALAWYWVRRESGGGQGPS